VLFAAKKKSPALEERTDFLMDLSRIFTVFLTCDGRCKLLTKESAIADFF